MSLSKSSRRKSSVLFFTVVSRGLYSGFWFFVSALASAWLSPALAGLVVTSMAVTAYSTVGYLGGSNTIARDLIRDPHLSLHQKLAPHIELCTIQMLAALGAVLIATGLILHGRDLSIELLFCIGCFALIHVVTILQTLPIGISQATEHPLWAEFQLAFPRLVFLCVLCGGILAQQGLTRVIGFGVFAFLAAALVLAFVAPSTRSVFFRISLIDGLKEKKELLQESLVFAAWSLLGLVFVALPVSVAVRYFPEHSVSFNLAMTFGAIPSGAIAAVLVSKLPGLAKAHLKGDVAQMHYFVRLCSRLQLIGLGASLIVLLALSQAIPGLRRAGQLEFFGFSAVLILVAFFFRSMAFPITQLAIASNRLTTIWFGPVIEALAVGLMCAIAVWANAAWLLGLSLLVAGALRWGIAKFVEARRVLQGQVAARPSRDDRTKTQIRLKASRSNERGQ